MNQQKQPTSQRLKAFIALGLILVFCAIVLQKSFQFAQIALNLGKTDQARFFFTLSALIGDARAQNNLAGMYAEGLGGEQSNSSAVYWYERAASAGITPAMFNLANFYEEGRGVSRSTSKAILLFQKAAEKGDVEASFNLGVIYSSQREDLQPDYAIATKWYLQAANAGYASAQYNLGSLYATGKNGQKDIEEAKIWYEKAAMKNHPKALLDLGSIHAFNLANASDLKVGLQMLSKATKIPETSESARQRFILACAASSHIADISSLCSNLNVEK